MEQLLVRNEYGNEISISYLSLFYEKGNKTTEEKSNGTITYEMIKLLSKARPGHQLTIVATVQEKGEMIPTYRTFDIIEE